MGWLAERLKKADPLILIGAFDPLCAKAIEAAGAEVCYCAGFSACAAAYALPDLGLLGLAEMTEHYRRVRAAVATPMIVDADAGHGGVLNVQRTISQFGALGIAACHIEDQVFPKRCGHIAGKQVVDAREAMMRVRVAVEAGAAVGLDVIARTDAIATHGFQAAIDRANSFLDMGAVAVFIDAPESIAQIEQIPTLVAGPVVFNAAPTRAFGTVSREQLVAWGFRTILHPVETLLAAFGAVQEMLPQLLQRGTAAGADFAHLAGFLDTEAFLSMERRHSTNHRGVRNPS